MQKSTCTGAVQMDNYRIQKKLSRICPERPAGIELALPLVRNNHLVVLK